MKEDEFGGIAKDTNRFLNFSRLKSFNDQKSEVLE